MEKYAIIVAGGTGVRMGTALPKQFLLIHKKPILWYTLHVFLKSFKDIRIILVLPDEFFDAGRAISDEVVSAHPIETITGGETRFHSVQNGLSLVKEKSVVFVHDAVRCLVSPSLIHQCYEETLLFGSAIPCVESKDSVRIVQPSGHLAVKRTDVKMVQTPQTFFSEILVPSYQTDYQEIFTDDASVVEAAHHSVHLVEGDANNIKITTPLDLAIAERLLDPPQPAV